MLVTEVKECVVHSESVPIQKLKRMILVGFSSKRLCIFRSSLLFCIFMLRAFYLLILLSRVLATVSF